MEDWAVKNIACATLLQAVKDYVDFPNQRKAILKDLRGEKDGWMPFFTQGQSLVVADQLETNLDAIAARLHNQEVAC